MLAASKLAWLPQQLTDEGNVVLDLVARKTRKVIETSKGADAREDRIGLVSSGIALRSNIRSTRAHLLSSVTRKSVVPDAAQRTFDGNLVMIVTFMGRGYSQKASNSGDELQHDCSYERELELWFWRRENKR